jgi:hypothetical protein
VFDESDLLLSGGYGAQMRIIWDALRAGDRTHAARRICLQVGAGAGSWAWAVGEGGEERERVSGWEAAASCCACLPGQTKQGLSAAVSVCQGDQLCTQRAVSRLLLSWLAGHSSH